VFVLEGVLYILSVLGENEKQTADVTDVAELCRAGNIEARSFFKMLNSPVNKHTYPFVNVLNDYKHLQTKVNVYNWLNNKISL
jgi:hypothetical protein